MENEDEFVQIPSAQKREPERLTQLPLPLAPLPPIGAKPEPVVEKPELAMSEPMPEVVPEELPEADKPVVLPVSAPPMPVGAPPREKPVLLPVPAAPKREARPAKPEVLENPESPAALDKPVRIPVVPAIAEPAPEAQPQKLDVRKRITPLGDAEGLPVMVEAAPQEEHLEEEVWGEGDRPSQLRPLLPLIVICLIALAIGGVAIWYFNKTEEEAVEISRVTTQVPELAVPEPLKSAPPVDPAQEAREEQSARKMLVQMEQLVRAYLNAPTREEQAKHVRFPDYVAGKMEDHYRRHPYAPRTMDALGGVECIAQDTTTNFWRVRYVQGGVEQGELLVAEAKDTGVLKVDWESDVNYQPMDWDEFVLKRPPGIYDFRVELRQGNLYSHEFANEAAVNCFKICGPGGEETAYGYLARDSQASKLLTDALKENGGKGLRVILRVRLPEDLKSPRGVVIEQLLAPSWWYAKLPEGEKAGD